MIERAAAAVDTTVAWLTEPLAAVLLVAEVVILAAGVFSRYVLKEALVWSDELATTLLVWLVMLGTVAAYRRRQHIRLTALRRRVGSAAARVLDVVSAVVVGIFALELLPGSRAYLAQEQGNRSPSLGIPHGYVVAAIVAAMILILALVAVRLLQAPRKVALAVLAGALLVGGAAVAGRGAFAALGNGNLVLFFVVLVGACVAIGVPIAFAFGFASLSYLALTTQVPIETVVGRMDEGISSLILLAIPLFILLGALMENAGIARRLVEAFASLFGHLRGGLGIVLVFAMYVVSGISGSKMADMAALAPVLLPEMERRGTPRSELVAMLTSSAAMAETIPPSLVLIIIGSVTGVSIAALFAAGLVPAAVAAVCLLVVLLIRSRRDPRAARPPLAAIAKALLFAVPGFALPFLIRAAILGGVATATEVSTIAILYTVLVGVAIYRDFRWSRVVPILCEAASLTGALMFIIATSTAMAWSLTQSGFAQQLSDALGRAPGGAAGFMALSVLLFVVLGSVLEGIPALVLFGPLLFPIAQGLHIHPVHYAIVAVLAMGVGLFAPPLGAGFYAACAISGCEPERAAGPVVPYLLAIVAALVAVAAVPALSSG